MNALLINPPMPYNYEDKDLLTWSYSTPIGLPYLAAILEKNEIEVEILDLSLLPRKIVFEFLARELGRISPQIIGITTTTVSFEMAMKIAKICKNENKDTKVVLGGPHVTFAAEETLRDFPSLVDFIVRYEGEYTFLELVRALQLNLRIDSIRGLALIKNGVVHTTPRRPFIMDLDELPFPSRHLLPLNDYPSWTRVGISSSRGCPYQCIFCVVRKMNGQVFRARNSEKLVDELEVVSETCKGRIFFLGDDNFTMDSRRALQICNDISDRGLNVKWEIESRVDTVNPILLEKLKAAGCCSVYFGIEAGSQKMLNILNKRFTVEQAENAVRMANEAGIEEIVAGFLLGVPGETVDDASQTIRFATTLAEKYDAINHYHFLVPFPGTDVAERLDELGLKVRFKSLSQYNFRTPVMETETLTIEDQIALFYEFYQMQKSAKELRKENIEKKG